VKKKIKVVMLHRHRFELWNAPGWVAERLRREFPELEVVHLQSYEQLDAEIGEAEGYIGWSIRPEQFVKAKKLRWVHSPAAAVHQLMFPEMVRSGVVVTNARSVHGPVVAEGVMALLLAVARRVASAVRYQQRHEWGQMAIYEERPRPRELRGATLLLVGYGAIGRELVKRARAFEMKVVVVREHPRKEEGIEVHGTEELDAVLPRADFVVLAAPVTPKTTGLMNRERLGRMKSDAYVVNVGRGPLVDEEALLEALREKKIAGAALDVFATEPLPRESPLWEAPGLLITPHMTAIIDGDTLWARHYELIAENMRRWLAGREMLNVVDKSRGY
jgi:phosphoglycerate dehydrogenase-like enzyme